MKKTGMIFGMIFMVMVIFSSVQADDRAALRGDFTWIGGSIYNLMLYERVAGTTNFVLIGENPTYNMKSFDEIVESYQAQGYDVDIVITVTKKNPSSIPVPSYAGGCQDSPWKATYEWSELTEGYYAVMIDARSDGSFKWKLVFRQGEYIVPVDCPKESYYPTAVQLDARWGNSSGNFYSWIEDRFVFE